MPLPKAPILPQVVDIASGHAYIQPEPAPIKPDDVSFGGGGGGGGGPVEPNVSLREYVDKADDLVEIRVSAKLDAVLLKMDGLATKESLDLQRLSVVHTIWGGVAATVLAILAVLAFGADRFDGGAAVSPQLVAMAQNQASVDSAQDARADRTGQKLDLIVKQTAR